MILLGLDIGTTRTKAIAYDTDEGRVTESESAPTPVIADATGDRRDADAVYSRVLDVARRVIGRIESGRVRGVAVASLGEEITMLDDSGRVLLALPTWYAREPRADDGRMVGPAHRESSWYKVAAAVLDHPDAVGRADSLVDLSDFVAMRLVGAKRPVMNWSHASRTGFFSPEERRWDVAAFAATGASPELLPELVPSGSAIGTMAPRIAGDLGLPGGVSVVAGGHDHFCGAFAAGIRGPGEAFVSVGTSESQLVLLGDEPSDADLVARGLEVGRYVDLVHRYAHLSQPSGLRFAELVGDDVDLDELYGRLEKIGTDPGALDDVFLRSVDALLLRLAEESAEASERLASVASVRLERIVVGGAPVDRPFWRRLRRAASSVPVAFLRERELTALGAALLAQRAVTGHAEPPAIDFYEDEEHPG